MNISNASRVTGVIVLLYMRSLMFAVKVRCDDILQNKYKYLQVHACVVVYRLTSKFKVLAL